MSDTDDDGQEQTVRIIGPVPSSNDEYDGEDDGEDDDDEGPEPITSFDELVERVRLIRELIPGAMISLIQPCDVCGLNMWDQATHDVHGNCRYLAYRSVAGDMHLARIEYEHWCTITYKESTE